MKYIMLILLVFSGYLYANDCTFVAEKHIEYVEKLKTDKENNSTKVVNDKAAIKHYENVGHKSNCACCITK